MPIAKLVVEFIGTYFLVLTIGLVVPEAGPLAPVAIGAVLIALVYMGGPTSGAHYNPAVTLAVLLRGRCTARDAGPYIAVQLLAALAAALTAMALAPAGGPVPPMELNTLPALAAEAIFTFALCWVILCVATLDASAGNQSYGVAIGLTVMAGAFAVGPISGAAFNPAVTLAVGVWGVFAWQDLWIQLAGEVIGAVAAAFLFRAVFVPPPPPAAG